LGVQKSKGKASCAGLYRHRGHIDPACPAGHLKAVCFFLSDFFLNQKAVLVSGMPVVRLCGWSVGREVFWCGSGLVFYLDDGDVEERAAEADGEGGGGHDGRAGQEPHGHGERRHLVPARDDPRLQRHEQPCTGKATSRCCQSVTRERKIHLLFHRWTGVRPERIERMDARTEAEHGHAEAGVGEYRDGLEDDRRHLEVPSACQASRLVND
jgi:hypothetical protein